MFSHSMQSQSALREQQQNLQGLVAAYEQRLRDADEARRREVAATHAKAQQALRDLQAQHDEALKRAAEALADECRRTEVERRRADDAKKVIDELREERARLTGGRTAERMEEELADAREEARQLQLEVSVLTQRLQAREAVYQQEMQRRDANERARDTEEQERDALLRKAQAAWKRRLQELEQQLEEASSGRRAPADAGASASGGPVAGSAPPSSRRSASAARNLAAEATRQPASSGDTSWPQLSQPQQVSFGASEATFLAADAASTSTSIRRSKSGGRKEERRREKAAAAAQAGFSSGPLEPPRAAFGGAAPAGVQPGDFAWPMDGGGASGTVAGAGDRSWSGGGGASGDGSEIAQLVTMGFSEERARQVLQEVDGNMDQALHRLLAGSFGGEPAAPAAPVASLPGSGWGGWGGSWGSGALDGSGGRGSGAVTGNSRGSRQRSSSRRGRKPLGDTPSPVDPAAVAQLVAMGFSEQQAHSALSRAGGDMEAALSLLMA